MFRKFFIKSQVLTIPNLMSLFRLVLIPFIMISYFRGQYMTSIILVAVSAFTDIVDGRIARHFNMVSDLGKMLDPFADKLTEGALIICLIRRYRLMIALLILMAAKETMMIILGVRAIKKDSVNSAKWYGKLCTVILYGVMLALLLFPRIPDRAANLLILVCMAVAAFTMIMYARFYHGILQETDKGV